MRFRHVLFWEFPCPAWAVASCSSGPKAGELPTTKPKNPYEWWDGKLCSWHDIVCTQDKHQFEGEFGTLNQKDEVCSWWGCCIIENAAAISSTLSPLLVKNCFLVNLLLVDTFGFARNRTAISTMSSRMSADMLILFVLFSYLTSDFACVHLESGMDKPQSARRCDRLVLQLFRPAARVVTPILYLLSRWENLRHKRAIECTIESG